MICTKSLDFTKCRLQRPGSRRMPCGEEHRKAVCGAFHKAKAAKSHARFDEGGLIDCRHPAFQSSRVRQNVMRTEPLICSLLYPYPLIRGIEQRNIFENNYDRDNLLKRLGKLLPATKTSCYAWAMLSNHSFSFANRNNWSVNLKVK